MNEEPKSIWKRPFQGWIRILTWFGLLAIVAFIAFWCMNAASSSQENLRVLVPGALAIAALLLGLIFFIRWLCHWRNLRRFLFGVVCFVTLIVLALSEENWRGKQAWENHRREWAAKGEKFTIAELVAPPVSDDKNFALTPLFKPIYDFAYTTNGIRWRDTNAYQHLQQVRADLSPKQGRTNNLVLGNLEKGTFANLDACRDFYCDNTNYPQPKRSGTAAADILVALGKFDADLAQLHEADAARPYSRFPIKYDEEPSWGILLPHLANVKGISVLVQMRAIARLEAGQTNAAFEDLKLGFRLSDSINNEPLLIDHLVRLATMSVTLQTLREGLARHDWSDQHLIELEKILSSLDLLSEYKMAMRGERACNVEGLDYLRRHRSQIREMMMGLAEGQDAGAKQSSAGMYSLVPGGWLYHNMLAISEMHQEFTIPIVDERKHLVSLEILRRAEDANAKLANRGYNPYKIFARMFFPAVTKAALRSGRMQAFVDEARVACALDRYRLATGRLPEKLDALAPRFIDAIPNDVIDGKPLRYRQTGDGDYVVYSIGSNEKDDGGVIVLKSSGSPPVVDWDKSDWVWQMPAK